MRIALSLLVLATTLLGGCTAPDTPDPVTVLHESHTVGERLFSHGWTPFMAGITAPITVKADVASLGMRFTGSLADEDGRTNATLKGPEGEERLALRAARGLPDDTTTIIEDFVLTGATPAGPGEWELKLDVKGRFERATIEVHAIPQASEPLTDIFDVPRDGRLDLEIQVSGWGDTPADFVLERTDGTRVTTIPVVAARATVDVDIQVKEGSHRIVADTPGWGGTLAWRAVLR